MDAVHKPCVHLVGGQKEPLRVGVYPNVRSISIERKPRRCGMSVATQAQEARCRKTARLIKSLKQIQKIQSGNYEVSDKTQALNRVPWSSLSVQNSRCVGRCLSLHAA